MLLDKIIIITPAINNTQKQPTITQYPYSISTNTLRDILIKKTDLVSQAAEYAAIKHSGQYRKDGVTPYFQHCKNVGNMLKEAGVDQEVIAAGYLHDTVEDTDTTIHIIRMKFGDKVASYVGEVTHEDGSKSWEEKTQRYLENIKKASPEAQTISACDKIDNIRSSNECLRNGIDIFKKLKGGPEAQIKKFKDLFEVYKKGSVPKPIVRMYLIEFNNLLVLAKKFR